MPVGGMHLAERSSHNLDLRMLLDDFVDHPDEGAGVELVLGGSLRSRDAQSQLEVFLVPNQHIRSDLICGCFLTTLSIIPMKALGSSLFLAAVSGPGMPSPNWRSSSFPTSTSTFFTMRSSTATARSCPPEMFQSLAR